MDFSPTSGMDESSSENAGQAGIGEGGNALRADREFERFFEDYYGVLVGYLRHLASDVTLAADIAQEAMLETYKHWSQVIEPRPYARSVARRIFLNELKDRSERRGVLANVLPNVCEMSDEFAGIEAADVARRFLAMLPPRQQTILFLRSADFKPSEIASILGMSVQTVRQYLWRAHQNLARRRIAEVPDE
jgi:RNA polymerase sigma factor (sigma-70 family)